MDFSRVFPRHDRDPRGEKRYNPAESSGSKLPKSPQDLAPLGISTSLSKPEMDSTFSFWKSLRFCHSSSDTVKYVHFSPHLSFETFKKLKGAQVRGF